MRLWLATVLALSCALTFGGGMASSADPPGFEVGVRSDKGTDIEVQSKALEGWISKEGLAATTVTVVRSGGKEETAPAKPGTPCKLKGLKPGDSIRLHAGTYTLEARIVLAAAGKRTVHVDEEAFGERKALRFVLLTTWEPGNAARPGLSVECSAAGVSAQGGSGGAGDENFEKNPLKGGLSPLDDATVNGKKIVDLLRKPLRLLQTADGACAVILLKPEDVGAKK
jgi:hypothetical protein